MEYKEFAKYYDKFYQNKDYQKEVNFLKNFINKKDKIIDIGCGTGIHASLLEKDGYTIDGLDLNKEMLDIAKNRLSGNLYNQNILNIKLNKKYNTIISMFAVINHLKDTIELEQVLFNLKKILLPNGKIIIDLHNPKSSGTKTDSYDNIKRTMIWDYDKKLKIEKSKIIFEIDNDIYNDSHAFRIFTIKEITETCEKVGLKVSNIFENYNIDKIGNKDSKNLQFIIVRK